MFACQPFSASKPGSQGLVGPNKSSPKNNRFFLQQSKSSCDYPLVCFGGLRSWAPALAKSRLSLRESSATLGGLSRSV